MLNDTIIVQSAISAFNNAALVAPAFLWWAILAMPIFVVAYMLRGQILARIGWTRDVMPARASMLVVVCTLLWIVMFGGNYGVLRDGVSLLPFMSAAILLAGGLFVGSHTRDKALPAFRGASRGRRLMYLLVVAAALLMLVRSDMHAWWGPLLQIGALALGVIVGRKSHARMRAIPGAILVMLAATTAVLMQPEFFRFGQLGSLSIVHMAFVMLVGVFAAATVAVRNINPRGRVHRSAYIKLKYMARFVSVLCVALFFLTESVPVFLGTTVALFVSFALSVWHSSDLPQNLGGNMFAATMMAFGIIMVMPAITALGIICWDADDMAGFWRQARFLL